jgi:hypothetical protein
VDLARVELAREGLRLSGRYDCLPCNLRSVAPAPVARWRGVVCLGRLCVRLCAADPGRLRAVSRAAGRLLAQT